MKIKNFFSCACAAAIAALSLVGCSDYDNGYTEQQLKFIQGFKDVFGEIDHSNDWNLAERGSVTVTTSKPSNVKIYANTFGTYQIVGDYKDVSGTRTLGFDMVEGTTDILVSDGHSSQKVNVGDAVIFSGTRYVYTGSESKTNEDGSPIVSVGDVEEYFDYDTYIKIVTDPETGHLPEEKQNLGKITQNFTYVSQGPFTIYPLHVESSSCHILGVYWRDGDADDASKENLKTQLVYRNNGQHNPTDEWRHPTWEDNKDWEDSNEEDEDNNNNKDGNKYSSDDVFAKPITINLPPGTVFGFYIEVYKGDITHDDDGTMHFPNEYDDKFYHCLYSAAARNAEQKGEPLEETTTLTVSENSAQLIRYIENGLTAFAGTFRTSVVNDKGEDEEICYLGFEDWATDKIFDLNDLVFIIKGDPLPVILDEDPTSWVLSAEDLGGTFDIDYNDVVIKVSHISGKQDLTVEPLAAGGTLASYLYFNDGLVETEEDLSIGEIHSFFGQGTTISGNYKPVNVTADDIDEDGKPLRTAIIPDDSPLKDLKVSEDWSLASFTPNTASANAKELAKNRTMGGFYVKVVPQGLASDEKNVREQVNENGDKVIQRIQNTVERNEDNVPYIICTPYNWRRPAKNENGEDQVYAGTYRWPREHVPMFPFGDFQDKGAYHNTSDPAHSFKSWVRGRYDENHAHIQTSVYWYRYPDIDLTVGEKIPVLVEDDGNTGNGGTEGDNGKKMYLQIVKNNDWNNAIFGYGNLLTESVDLSETEHTFQKGDNIQITVWDYDYMGTRNRKNLSAEYDYDNDGYADEIFDKDIPQEIQFSIQVKGEPGIQTITVIGGEEEGYKAYSIKITFKVVSSGSVNPDDPNGGGLTNEELYGPQIPSIYENGGWPIKVADIVSALETVNDDTYISLTFVSKLTNWMNGRLLIGDKQPVFDANNGVGSYTVKYSDIKSYTSFMMYVNSYWDVNDTKDFDIEIHVKKVESLEE